MIHSKPSPEPDRATRPGGTPSRRAEVHVRAFRYLTERPLVVLGLLTVAFLVWIVADAGSPRPTAVTNPAPPTDPPGNRQGTRTIFQ